MYTLYYYISIWLYVSFDVSQQIWCIHI